MTAFLTIKKEFSPVSRCWGFAALHDATGEGSWDFTENGAVLRIMKRLVERGYDRWHLNS